MGKSSEAAQAAMAQVSRSFQMILPFMRREGRCKWEWELSVLFDDALDEVLVDLDLRGVGNAHDEPVFLDVGNHAINAARGQNFVPGFQLGNHGLKFFLLFPLGRDDEKPHRREHQAHDYEETVGISRLLLGQKDWKVRVD